MCGIMCQVLGRCPAVAAGPPLVAAEMGQRLSQDQHLLGRKVPNQGPLLRQGRADPAVALLCRRGPLVRARQGRGGGLQAYCIVTARAPHKPLCRHLGRHKPAAPVRRLAFFCHRTKAAGAAPAACHTLLPSPRAGAVSSRSTGCRWAAPRRRQASAPRTRRRCPSTASSPLHGRGSGRGADHPCDGPPPAARIQTRPGPVLDPASQVAAGLCIFRSTLRAKGLLGAPWRRRRSPARTRLLRLGRAASSAVRWSAPAGSNPATLARPGTIRPARAPPRVRRGRRRRSSFSSASPCLRLGTLAGRPVPRRL